jgi:hypothetical protein
VISDYKTQIEELKARLEGNTLDVVPEEALEITETIIIDPKSLEDDELPEIKIEIEDDESDESEIFEETTIPELSEISETEEPSKNENNSAAEDRASGSGEMQRREAPDRSKDRRGTRR